MQSRRLDFLRVQMGAGISQQLHLLAQAGIGRQE